jgi:hypothetical protein
MDLFAKREAERAALAHEAQYRAWREGASTQDLRDADAVAAARNTAQAQLAQVSLKDEAVQAAAAREVEFARQNLELKKKKDARFAADMAEAAAREVEAKAMREAQLRELAARRGQDARDKAAEVASLKAKWAADDAAAAAADVAAAEAAKRRGEELTMFNLAKLASNADIAAREKAFDAALAAAAAARAAEAEAAELAAREAKRRGDAAYRACLAASREKQAESDAEREAMMEQYNKAVQDAQDAIWNREAAARARLQAEVIANNDAQLAGKASAREADVREGLVRRAQAEADGRAAAAERVAMVRAQADAIAARKAEIDAQVSGNVASRNAAAAAQAAKDAAAAAAFAEKERMLREYDAQRRGGVGGRGQRMDPAAMPAAGTPLQRRT